MSGQRTFYDKKTQNRGQSKFWQKMGENRPAVRFSRFSPYDVKIWRQVKKKKFVEYFAFFSFSQNFRAIGAFSAKLEGGVIFDI